MRRRWQGGRPQGGNRGRWSPAWVVLSAGLAAALLLVETRSGAAQSGRTIERVVIEGNQRVDEEAIRVQIRSAAGAPLDATIVGQDVKAIYGMGLFERVDAERQEEGGRSVLVFHVVERPLIRTIRIEGADHVKAEELEAALRVSKHTILDAVKVREGLAAGKKLYEEEGYLDAVIEERTVDLGGNEVELVYKIDEKKRVLIRKIEFEGNTAFSDRKLRGVMATKKKGLLSRFTGSGILKRDVLEIDRERLTAVYYEDGYISVRVDEPVVERRGEGLFVTIKVDEGDQYRIGRVKLSGAGGAVTDPEKVVERLSSQPGRVFSASALRKDVETVTDAFADKGYAFATVEPSTDIRSAERLVDVEFVAERGPEVYIDRIEIAGNVKTRDKVVRRELRVQEQQRFSATELRKSREALQRLGFFRAVDIKTRQVAPTRLDVAVEVEEGQTGAFSAGAGFSSADRLLFNVRVSEINLFGRGQRIVLNADFGSLRRNFILSFTEPYLLDTRLTLGLDAFSWRLIFSDFTREGTGVGSRLLYPVTAFGWDELWGMSLEEVRIGLDYRLEQAKISEISSSATRSIRLEKGTSLISSVTPRVRRNTLNHAFDPTAGSFQDVGLEFAGLGGDTTFLKATARSRWYRSFWESPTFGTFTYSLGATVGWGFGDEGTSGDELPLFERFFPGGLDSVRGYKVRSLGPREKRLNTFGKTVDETEIGGSQELVVNNEIIFPIIKGLGMKGVVFFDAGEAFTADQGIQFGKLRYATGGAVRWLSPFGPLQMGIGFPVNPREDDDKSVLLFSFGGPLQ
jgi:outer membrane protein insertion porin family